MIIKKTDSKEECIINKIKILETLSNIEKMNEKNKLNYEIRKIIKIVRNPINDNLGLLNISNNDETIEVSKDILIEELNQIVDAQTIERAKYYIKRLKKVLMKSRRGK